MPPRPLLLNWPHLILCTVQFNYLSRNCVRETKTFHATGCGLPSLRCSLFDLLEFELECMMCMNPILYGHLQRKFIGSYHEPCDPGIFLSRCKVQEWRVPREIRDWHEKHRTWSRTSLRTSSQSEIINTNSVHAIVRILLLGRNIVLLAQSSSTLTCIILQQSVWI